MSSRIIDQSKLHEFIVEFLRMAHGLGRIYLTVDSSAVLYGWRVSMIDIDLIADPEPESFFRILQDLMHKMGINLELASPDMFVPALPRWQDRCVWIAGKRDLNIYHFDFYTQAVAKISRGHPRDMIDVNGMLQSSLIKRSELWELFQESLPLLERYPAIEQNHLILTMERFCMAHE